MSDMTCFYCGGDCPPGTCPWEVVARQRREIEALEAELGAVLRVESEVDVAVVPVSALGTVEDGGVAGEEPRALRNPSGQVRVFARKLRRTVSKAHGRIVP